MLVLLCILSAVVLIASVASSKYERRHERVLVERFDEHERVEKHER